MPVFHKNLTIRTGSHNELVDVTDRVRQVLSESGVNTGQCTIYTPHATAGVTINENADPNIATDFLNALRKMVVEHDQWLHDQIDNNAAAHIKSALLRPSEPVQILDADLPFCRCHHSFVYH